MQTYDILKKLYHVFAIKKTRNEKKKGTIKLFT